MKKIVVVLVSLVVAVLIGVGNAFAHIPEPSLGPEWKLVFTGSHGSTLYVNTRRITYLPEGIVKVWVLGVPREETRRTLVNILRNNLLSKGLDPNSAKRLWYMIFLDKFNCKTHQVAELEDIYYSFGEAVLDDESFQPVWKDIPPGVVYDKIEKFVCK